MSLNWINWGLVWIAQHKPFHCDQESNLLTSHQQQTVHTGLWLVTGTWCWPLIGWVKCLSLLFVTRGKLEWMSPDESLETRWHQTLARRQLRSANGNWNTKQKQSLIICDVKHSSLCSNITLWFYVNWPQEKYTGFTLCRSTIFSTK